MESEPNRSIVPPADARNQRRRFPDDSEEEQQWENPGKRMKRGKYTPKACTYCQRRKIKCDGHRPCGQCSAKGKDCCFRSKDPKVPNEPTRAEGERSQEETTAITDRLAVGVNDQGQEVLHGALLRLARLESQLQSLTARENIQKSHGQAEENDTSFLNPRSDDISPNSPGGQSHGSQPEDPEHSEADLPAFSGETSMNHSLNQVEDHLEILGVRCGRIVSRPPSQPLTPPPQVPSQDGRRRRGQSNIIQNVLTSHGICVDKTRWDRYLQTFIGEVHVLYPFLHIPMIREYYERFWRDCFNSPANNQLPGRKHQIEVAQLLICLATGRCIGGSRLATEEGRHSAGWSLYSAAMDILGEPIETFTNGGSALLKLQTLLLMAVYLFRLDANEPASKILAITVSHAHQIGLHRQTAVSRMSVYESEQFRRLWWCIYVLDRRLSFETGLPFVIQDVNVDTALPANLSDDWLAKFKGSQLTEKELASDIDLEISKEPMTPIPYLVTMVKYSQVLGKVWEALYSARATDMASSPQVTEYLEHLVSEIENQTPPSLVYNPSDSFGLPTGASSWWPIKQKMLMRMRWTYLRLAMRKPTLQRSLNPSNNSDISSLENEGICIQLARRIFDDFNLVPDHYPKLEFPFPPYLVRTATLALGLIIKRPSFREKHGNATLKVARMLKRHCKQTWVSGKFIRSVIRLNHMAETVLDTQQMQADAGKPLLNGDLIAGNNMAAVSGDPPYGAGTSQYGNTLVPSDTRTRGRTRRPWESSAALLNSGRPSPTLTPPPPHAPCFTQGPQPSVDFVSPESGLMGFVTADYDFEKAMNGISPEVSGPFDTDTQVAHSSSTTTLPMPARNTANHRTMGADSVNGFIRSEWEEETRQNNLYGASTVKDAGVCTDWLQDLLGPGLDLSGSIY